MNVLVVGRSGQLATELRKIRWPGSIRVLALGREQLDLTDPATISAALAAAAPDIVVNAAAYTAVDQAEAEPALAFAVNEAGPSHLAEEAARRNIPLIQLSTDYVFSGSGERPWREDDEPAPLSAYGRSKLAGERAVIARAPKHIVLRTSWLFAAHGHNFVRTMLRLGAERSALRIVADQHGCPTAAADLARVIAQLACALLAQQGPFGIYHYAGAGAVSWYGFAAAIFQEAGDLLATTPALSPITTKEFAAPAPRPAFSVLDCSKIERDFGVTRRSWELGLRDVLAELRANREPIPAA